MTPHKDCYLCQNNLPFEMPDKILEAVNNKKLVIFAGAGISSESKIVIPYSFYDEICLELKIDPKTCDLSFSEVMTRFCTEFGRKKMIELLVARLNNIKSFPELYKNATRFHSELCTISQIRTIFTTNWDTFFEDETGSIPFVTSEDFVYWDLPERKVFKIHGSMANVGSIIATENDYKKCYKKLKTELIGNYLKIMLSTQTFVFCGYSFRDEDLRKILNLLKKELKDYAPKFFLVTTNKDIDKLFLKTYNVTPIFTDATFFLHSLKNTLVKNNKLIDDLQFERVEEKLSELLKIHEQLSNANLYNRFPDVIYTLAYQDGLKHSFERMLKMRNNGDYSDFENLRKWIYSYSTILSEREKQNRYDESCYIEGYLNGLVFLVSDKSVQKNLPLYHLYKQSLPVSNKKYLEILTKNLITHKKASAAAKKLIENSKIGENGLHYHHPSFFM